MYMLQRNMLITPVKRDRLSTLLERAPSLAKMGQRDEDKVLLALLPIWANDRAEKIPVLLEGKIQEWLENTRNNAVRKLWNKTSC